MSKNIVFEGWLTKSPPNKRLWRTKWRRRWFVLRQSGELPGQYVLEYYADRTCGRLKGTINLDLCEQVDAGLHMERNGNGVLDPKPRGSVFTIQTQSRIYHLEADCEAEMENWVNAICRICGLRATDDDDDSTALETFRTSPPRIQQVEADGSGAYIPISECITGVRAQRGFAFDPRNMVSSSRRPYMRASVHGHRLYLRHPQFRLHHAELSGNESAHSDDDESKSLTASRSNIQGPPVPPRPPKTLLTYTRHSFRREECIEGPPADTLMEEDEDQEDEVEIEEIGEVVQMGTLRPQPRRSSVRVLRGEDTFPRIHYSNLPRGASLPPAVDRALKPRFSARTFGHGIEQALIHSSGNDSNKGPDTLHYLDLDLPPSSPVSSRAEISHGRSQSASEPECEYRTVDFLKTEAFNMTRQDAEALRGAPQ